MIGWRTVPGTGRKAFYFRGFVVLRCPSNGLKKGKKSAYVRSFFLILSPPPFGEGLYNSDESVCMYVRWRYPFFSATVFLCCYFIKLNLQELRSEFSITIIFFGKTLFFSFSFLPLPLFFACLKKQLNFNQDLNFVQLKKNQNGFSFLSLFLFSTATKFNNWKSSRQQPGAENKRYQTRLTKK